MCHKLLLYKLSKLNLDHNVLKWIESFLANRSQFVTANGHDSPHSDVQSGVPQGSVLGPLLFLIYINDLPSAITSDVHLFADDCVILREITNEYDISLLQADLNNVSEWCRLWRMELNINKCKFLRVSRSNDNLPVYYLNNVALESTNSYKYLGLHITSKLTWNHHVEYIINQANRLMGYLRRNFSHAPSPLKLLLYKTLLRPKLEYAAAIWDPYHENLIHSLELIQNNATRFILWNYYRGASVSSMKSNLGLQPLATRRKISRLSFFISCITTLHFIQNSCRYHITYLTVLIIIIKLELVHVTRHTFYIHFCHVRRKIGMIFLLTLFPFITMIIFEKH